MGFSGWGRRCELVIQSSQVTQDCIDFPVLVHEDTLPSEIFDADGSYPALDGGGDIRFSSDEAGNTQLACEIESFVTDNDPANGKAAIWVKVPSLSSSANTTIYIWYNKAAETQPAEDNAYGKENVWDSNFVMVQHMNQTPTGSAGDIVDSTSNNNDGTTSGMDSADQVAGQIDGSLDFDGDGDYVDCGDINDTESISSLSISAWIRPSAIMTNAGIVSKRATGSDGSWQFLLFSNSKLYFRIYTSNGTFSVFGGTTSISDTNKWYHVVAIYNGSNIVYYVDTVMDVTPVNATGIIDSTTDQVLIGSYFADPRHLFDGIQDEVRISNIARSAGWIETEYNNQNSPGTFLIEGTPETPGAPPPTFIPQIIIF